MSTNIKKARRIGIFAGTFDPVHAGHISFALQAIKAGKLDAIYFTPERRPRSKTGVEHFGHRVAMLQKAVQPHAKLRVLELEDVEFTIKTSLPRIQKYFQQSQLVFLVGSDVVQHLPQWPHAQRLLETSELLVGVRAEDSCANITNSIARWFVQPRAVEVLQSQAATISSRSVRTALRKRQYTPGLLTSVQRYSNRNWLYVSLAISKLQQKTQ